MRGFSAGQIFVTLGAEVAHEGWDNFDRLNARAAQIAGRGHHVRLAGDFVGDGFNRFDAANRGAEATVARFSAAAIRSMGGINGATREMGAVTAREMALVRGELGATAGEYHTVAEAAAHSAAQQRAAMSEIAGAAAKTEASVAASSAKAKNSWEKGFGAVANVGKWTVVGGAVASAASLKMAGDFQKHMELVSTQAGYSQKAVDRLSKAVLNLAPSVGVAPTKLADGLYQIASSGVPASKAMDLLANAAKGAKIGNDDMTSVTKALVFVMNSGLKDVHSFSDAMSKLDLIAGHGNMVMKDLTAAMSSGLLPAASAVGLGINDVGAALDVLTTRGVPAEAGATRLRTTLNLIASPTKKAKDALAELGFQGDTLAKAFREKGLVGALDMLQGAMNKVFGQKLTAQQTTDALNNYHHTLIGMGVTGKALDKQMTAFHMTLDKQGEGAIKSAQLISNAFGGARMGTTMQVLMQNVGDVKTHFDDLNKTAAQTQRIFDTHWKQTSQTFNQQMSEMWAGIQKLLIQLGEKLIPTVEKLTRDLQEGADWLGKHKKAAELLAYTFGTVLTVAVAAWFTKLGIGLVNNIKNMALLGAKIATLPVAMFEKMTGLVNTTTTAVEGTNAALTEQIALTDEATVSMGRLARTGEEVTAGGVILPRGKSPGGVTSLASAERASTEAAVASSSLRGRIGTGLRGMGSRAGSAAGIGFTGLIGSQLLGGAIGGSTGKSVTSIGTDASIGAGLGMLLGPEGAVAGGVLGGLVGGFSKFLSSHKAHEYGNQIADQTQAGLDKLHLNIDPKVKSNAQSVVRNSADEIARIQKEINQANNQIAAGGSKTISGSGLWITHVDPNVLRDEVRKQQALLQPLYEKMGRAVASEFNSGVEHGPKFQTKGTMVSQMRAVLATLPPAARSAAADSMLQMTATLEKEGRLPAGSLAGVVKDMLAKVGVFGPQATKMAKDAMQNIADEISKNKMVKNVQTLVDDASKTFADLPSNVHVSAKNMRSVWEAESKLLKEHMHTGTREMRDDARKLWEDMHTNVSHYSHLMNKDSGKELDSMLGKFQQAAVGIDGAMAGASQAIADQGGYIASTINDLAKSLGDKGIKFVPGKTPSQNKKLVEVLGSPGQAGPLLTNFTTPKKATGGIAHAGGSAADDHILMDPSGAPVAALSGTEGIINAPQMDIIDHALGLAHTLGALPAQFGSLGGLWGSGLRHFATGGNLAPGAGLKSQVSLAGVHPGVIAAAKAIEHMFPGLIITSGTGGTHAADSYHYRGEALDIGGSTPLMNTAAKWINTSMGKNLTEGIHNPGLSIKDGAHVPASFWGSTVWGEHANHIHVAVAGALGKLSGLASDGSFSLPSGHIAGPPGGILNLAQAASKLMHHMGNTYAGGLAGTDSSIPNATGPWVSVLHKIAKQLGWNPDAWLQVVSMESSGNPNAVNPSSGAYGLGQMLGANLGKYYNRGDSATKQIRGMAQYIKDRYGNPTAALAHERKFHWYNAGGLLARGASALGVPGFAGGGSLGRSKIPPALRVKPRTTATKAAPKKRVRHAGPQVLPHKLSNLAKFGALVPGLGPVDAADAEIAAEDSSYSRDDRYFGIVDVSLTPDDTKTLLGIRNEQGRHLQEEETLESQAGTDLDTLAKQVGTGDIGGGTQGAKTKAQAQKVLRDLKKTEAKLKAEGRRMAKLRHTRAGKMLKIADDLAKRTADLANKRAAAAKRETSIRRHYADKLTGLAKWHPADTSSAIAAVHAKYKPKIDAAKTTAGKNSLTKQRDAELHAIHTKHKGEVDAHANQVKSVRAARDHALRPVQDERTKLMDRTRKIRQEEGKQRRKYQKQGWSEAWSIKTEEWKLQDKIEKLKAEEKTLSGSTTEVGSGGDLGKLAAEGKLVGDAQTALTAKEATTSGDIIDNALNQLELAGNLAQQQADTSGVPVDLASDLPDGIAAILASVGIGTGDIHRIYQPNADALGQGGTTTTDSTGTTTTTGAPSPADIAAAAAAEIASMDAASQAIYQQFGGNVVSRAAGTGQGSPYAAALGSGAFGPGARYFGAGTAGAADTGVSGGAAAAGLGASSGTGSSGVFNQVNHYQVGPEDPHIHAQVSALEFANAFG